MPAPVEHTLTAARWHNLKRLLEPRSIAFVGGTRAISAWRVTHAKGFAGKVYMVNPIQAEIDGIATYPSVADLPEAPDATYVALGPEKTIATAEILAARGAGGIVAFGSGFSEIGGDGTQLEQELIDKCGDMALIGPNCYGLINQINQGSLWPIPYPAQHLPPNVAIISQSGNVAINLVQNQRSVPMSHVISLGNQAGIQVHDLIDYFVTRPGMRAIGIYLDGLKDIGRFHDAAVRALKAGVAVVVLKAGESEVSAGIAMSHTNSLAGSGELYAALFDRTGVIGVQTIPAMLETLKVLGSWGLTVGEQAAFFSCSGGESSMAADFAAAAGLTMNQPDAAQTAALQEVLPEYGFVSNPVDLTTALFGKGPELGRAVEIMLNEAADFGVLVMDFAGDSWMADGSQAAMVDGLAAASRTTGKPVAVAAMKPEAIPPAVQHELITRNILPLQGIDVGLHAIAAVARSSRCHAAFQNDVPKPLLAAEPTSTTGEVLDEWASKRLLASFGISSPAGRLCIAEDIVAAAEEVGYPVVVKLCSNLLPHKTEAGAVALDLNSADDVRSAVAAIRENVTRYDPDLPITHFLVERMVGGAVAELILGVKSDPQFGPAIVVGTGGIFVELIKDARTLLLPTSRDTVIAAVDQLAGKPLFSGFRNRPSGDLNAIVAAVLALGRMVEQSQGTILEADINPLFVLPDGQGVIAGDALIRRQS